MDPNGSIPVVKGLNKQLIIMIYQLVELYNLTATRLIGTFLRKFSKFLKNIGFFHFFRIFLIMKINDIK